MSSYDEDGDEIIDDADTDTEDDVVMYDPSITPWFAHLAWGVVTQQVTVPDQLHKACTAWFTRLYENGTFE